MMAKSRQQYSPHDVSSSPTAVRSRERDGPSRWSEYLNPEMTSSMTAQDYRPVPTEGKAQAQSSVAQKGLNMQWVVQLTNVSEGLMAKMHRLNQILDYPDSIGNVYSEAFWKAGVFPNHPKICLFLSKKFPEHHSKLQLERVRIYLALFLQCLADY